MLYGRCILNERYIPATLRQMVLFPATASCWMLIPGRSMLLSPSTLAKYLTFGVFVILNSLVLRDSDTNCACLHCSLRKCSVGICSTDMCPDDAGDHLLPSFPASPATKANASTKLDSPSDFSTTSRSHTLHKPWYIVKYVPSFSESHYLHQVCTLDAQAKYC